MYNLKNREVIRTFTGHHANGIKQLTYISGYGGQLASRGFEISVNIWSPENLFGDPHFGTLKGHKQPVVSMDNLKNSPYLVTIDQIGELIIWDIRTKFQVQVINTHNSIKAVVHGIMCIDKEKFWLYGNRFFEFEKAHDLIEDFKDED